MYLSLLFLLLLFSVRKTPPLLTAPDWLFKKRKEGQIKIAHTSPLILFNK